MSAAPHDWRARVVAEAHRWIGTPYHHHARIHGAGVDCLQLLVAVFEGAGLAAGVEPGDYAPQWHLHRSEERYARGLDAYLRRRADVADMPPQPGDVALFKFGRCYSHGAIYVGDGALVHAYIGRGVIKSRIDEEPLSERPALWWTFA